MLGDFITRGLVLVLGYAYPAFECFKTVEKNRVDIEELRFWCQYWIIIATLTVLERIGDIFISWLPMYGEMKLALIIYLWYPKTKGSGYIYETLLKPYVAQHETKIDTNIQELRTRAWDLAIYYWQNCTQIGQTTFVQLLHFLASQSARMQGNSTTPQQQQQQVVGNQNGRWPPPSAPPGPPPPQPQPMINPFVSRSTNPSTEQVNPHNQTDSVQEEPPLYGTPGSLPDLDYDLLAARLRLRRPQVQPQGVH